MNCKDTQAAIDSASRRDPVSQSATAHLAGCHNCRHYADQSSALLALLGAQQRVEVPADFDFRLRARIARAESQPRSPFAFLENFFGHSFSIKQAAASLAAVVVMAAATAFYFTGGNQPAVNNATIAQVENPAPPQQAAPAMVTPAEGFAGGAGVAPQPMLKAASNARANAGRIKPAVFNEAPAKQGNVANKEEMIRFFTRQKGQVNEIPNRTLIGAEGSMAMAKPAAYTAF